MVQHWRAAGLTYLKYVQVGSNAMRLGLREDVRKKMMEREGYLITKRIWEGGKVAQACAPPPFSRIPPPPLGRARAGPRGRREARSAAFLPVDTHFVHAANPLAFCSRS